MTTTDDDDDEEGNESLINKGFLVLWKSHNDTQKNFSIYKWYGIQFISNNSKNNGHFTINILISVDFFLNLVRSLTRRRVIKHIGEQECPYLVLSFLWSGWSIQEIPTQLSHILTNLHKKPS